MSAGGITPQPNAVRIDAELAGLGTHELNCRPYVVDRLRICSGLGEPVFDGEHAIAVPREIRSPMAVGRWAPILPAATVNADDQRRLGRALGQVEIAAELCPSMFDVLHIGAGPY